MIYNMYLPRRVQILSSTTMTRKQGHENARCVCYPSGVCFSHMYKQNRSKLYLIDRICRDILQSLKKGPQNECACASFSLVFYGAKPAKIQRHILGNDGK